MPKKIGVLIASLLIIGCTESRVKRYETMLQPLMGTAKKNDISKLLGAPAFCVQEEAYERCEYRTSRGSNDPVPGVARQEASMGPDLSPYDYYDVLQIHYDNFGLLNQWEPIFVK